MSLFFVTGATGFVGRQVVETLRRGGHRVRGLGRDWSAAGPGHGVERIRGDLLDSRCYEDAVRDADAVLHVAGLLSARRREHYVRTNVDGTRALFDACVRTGSKARVVIVSSIAAMGPRHDGRPIRESDPCRPRTEYGMSKLEAECVAREYSGRVPVVILRPTFIHGAGDTQGPEHVRLLLDPGRESRRTDVRTMSFCHVEDVARCVLRAAEADVPSGEGYLVAEPTSYDWDSVGAALREAFLSLLRAGEIEDGHAARVALERLERLDSILIRGSRPDDWACDTSKAEAELAFRAALPLREGAREAVRAYAASARSEPLVAHDVGEA
ncbi:MAG TPA: NAD-dependent epimerase/dehydratase family protein [Candidatus Eisenbacteria bacterium]|nr:NAD-dependent epimerase/dehydratase family protein [Candidatus Eisenbacteria bacterium]